MKRALWAAVLALGLAGCASDGLLGNAFQPDIYVVRPGDTVYSIAWRYGIDPQALIRWNGLEHPDRLLVGQRLRLGPDRSTARRSAPAPSAGGSSGEGEPAAVETAAAPEVTGEERQERADSGTWRWPTPGEVVGTFTDGRVTGRGVDIRGEVGQPVKATAAGEVVYSGEGLQAYGRLVIIRHDGEYLSAYAHNRELLVREGQRVTAGQEIARMGESGEGEAMLHFEIRHQGKPVDPLTYLPARD